MYRSIVVGWDGGEQASDALALALCLGSDDALVRAAFVRHAEQSAPPAPAAGRARMEVVTARGAAEGLLTLAERVAADLVVVGSSHRGSTGRVLAGRVADHLLRGSPCPVAVAPSGYRLDGGPIRVVGAAYDGSPEAQAALAEAAAIARELEATVRVISVAEPLDGFTVSGTLMQPHEAGLSPAALHRAQLRDKLAVVAAVLPRELRAATVLVDGEAAAAIAEEARKGVHLLVMGSRGCGPLRRVLVGSTASALFRLAPSPLLVVPRGSGTPRAQAGALAATET